MWSSPSTSLRVFLVLGTAVLSRSTSGQLDDGGAPGPAPASPAPPAAATVASTSTAAAILTSATTTTATVTTTANHAISSTETHSTATGNNYNTGSSPQVVTDETPTTTQLILEPHFFDPLHKGTVLIRYTVVFVAYLLGLEAMIRAPLFTAILLLLGLTCLPVSIFFKLPVNSSEPLSTAWYVACFETVEATGFAASMLFYASIDFCSSRVAGRLFAGLLAFTILCGVHRCCYFRTPPGCHCICTK